MPHLLKILPPFKTVILRIKLPAHDSLGNKPHPNHSTGGHELVGWGKDTIVRFE
jgi:hypothetical protein